MIGLPILFKLLIAHFAGDFVLQSGAMAEKRTKSVVNKALGYHLLTHLACLLVLFLFRLEWWVLALVLGSHALIDMLKAWFEISLTKRALESQVPETDWKFQTWRIYGFVVDQLLHLLVIGGIWLSVTNQWQNLAFIRIPDKWWLIALAYLLVTKPMGIFIGKIVKRWYDQILLSAQTGTGTVTSGIGGLPNAGSWIGIIERVLTLSFILAGSYEAIGFLLAAKSILRIGDLKDDKEHKKTEYILIGTLLSFGLTIVLGLAVVLMC